MTHKVTRDTLLSASTQNFACLFRIGNIIHHHTLCCRDDGDEPSVPHPDPAVGGSQVPRGGVGDPAVRDQPDQQQEEAYPPPHRVNTQR